MKKEFPVSLKKKKDKKPYEISNSNPVSRVFCTIFWIDKDTQNFSEEHINNFLESEKLFHSWAVSPLHHSDADADTDSIESKKEHYHILLYTHTPQRLRRVRTVFKKLHDHFSTVFKVNDRLQYYRYLTHSDFPDKEQFSDLPFHSKFFKIPSQSIEKATIQDQLIEYLILNFEENSSESSFLLDFCLNGQSDFLLEYKKNHIFYEKIIRSLQALKS